jgi:hypothetical protein
MEETMNLTQEQALVAPCGIHCGLCELYTARDNPKLKSYLISRGIPESKIPCDGCRANKGHCPVHPGECATFTCISEKGHTFCHECEEFPCNRLQPAADRADILPHNLKSFQLSVVKNQGIERFLAQAPEFKKKYFSGKIEIGNGPHLSSESSDSK